MDGEREREEEDPLQEKVRAIYLQSGAMPDRVSSNNFLAKHEQHSHQPALRDW
jgi:hypothetical protein